MKENINILLKSMFDMDKKIFNIMKKGVKYSFYFCIFATIILITYEISTFPILFHAGISLLKSGIFFIVAFAICGFAFDKIAHEIN